jgi:hypothetical protein
MARAEMRGPHRRGSGITRRTDRGRCTAPHRSVGWTNSPTLVDEICETIDPDCVVTPAVSLHCDCGRWMAVVAVGRRDGTQRAEMRRGKPTAAEALRAMLDYVRGPRVLARMRRGRWDLVAGK